MRLSLKKLCVEAYEVESQELCVEAYEFESQEVVCGNI